MNIKDDMEKILDRVVLFALGIFCFLYSIFASNFAELHIQLPFLDFPIFVGEILLAFCIIMLLAKWKLSSIKFNRWHYLLFVYIIFILFKVFYGYFKWGPLAFRNAALFYYPLLAVIGYYFFNAALLKKKIIYFGLLSILVATVLFRFASSYFLWTYLILTIALLLQLKNKILKYISILVFVVVFPYRLLFTVARGILLSEIIACVFLFIALFSLLKIKLKYKALSSLFLLSIFTLFLHSFADKNAVKSLTTPGIMLSQYHQYSNLATSAKETIKTKGDVSIKLYEKASSGQLSSKKRETEPSVSKQPSFNLATSAKETIKTKGDVSIEENIAFSLPPSRVTTEQVAFAKQMTSHNALTLQKKKQYRSLDTAYANTLWRVFVWRDMLTELISDKAFLGISFGKPFRSKTIEALKWADGDWVGWLEPHNSYIHILYRTGVIGLLFIIVLWGLFIRVLKFFIKELNIKGILLSSILLYWLIVANFEVILELPYFAIPFWSLFGAVLRYSNKS